MTVTNFSKARKIPDVTTKKSAPTTTNFAKGIFTYKPNDLMDYDEIFLAQNARFDRIGEYKTRRGLEKLCEPIGKTAMQDNYTADYEMKAASTIEAAFSTTEPIYSVHLTIAADSTDYGVAELALVDENNKVVAVSCAQNVPTEPTDTEFIFKDGPSGNLSLKLAAQDGTQTYKVAVLTGTDTLMSKIYTATAGYITNIFEANIDGTITLLFTFYLTEYNAVGLYRMAADGTITLIRPLPSGVEKVRFSQNVNQIRYADGKEAPHIIDPTTWTDTAIQTIDLKTDVNLNIKTSNLMPGTEDNMIYFDADTTTQAVWTYPYGFTFAPEANYISSTTIAEYVPGETNTTTVSTSNLEAVSETKLIADIAVGDIILDDMGNYGEVTSITGQNIAILSIAHASEPINSYDKFDRDFRQNFPAIKTGDPLTAMLNLGGVVYFLTRRNKYLMYSQTADVWTQQQSSAQHGAFSQEAVACDLNYAYYANDDGIYVFDGSSEASLTEKSIQKTYDAINGKESITLELYNNRLYVFYSTKGDGKNDACLIYNINLKLWESFDTGLPVSATTARKTASNRFICGSSCFGQLYSFETKTNEYADLGAPIDFDLETSYLHFGTPSQLHRVTKWRPEFATTDEPYAVKCGYAVDFTDDVKYAYSINLKNQSAVDEHYVWDNPPDYGNKPTPTKLTTIPKVYGQFRRVQIRYQLHAAFEPVNFKSHTLCCQTERIR